MSSPIVIRRASASSECDSASSASTSPASPVRALYVPVHKRSASSASSATPPSSPSYSSRPESRVMYISSTIHPRIYSTDFLLSLRPFADEDIKEKLLAACPEAVITPRVRQRVAHTARATPKPAATTPTAKTTTMQRVTPRRTRFSGRAPERRRQALNLPSDTWRGLRNTNTPLPLISDIGVKASQSS